MDTGRLLTGGRPTGSVAALIVLLGVLVGAAWLADCVQTDRGRVRVSNVYFTNEAGARVRAKLLMPDAASPRAPLPGVVLFHGYQNNRETSDAYAIELARRGFVALSVDAIGRGNSDFPADPSAPGFDPTYGGAAAWRYLRSMPEVDPSRTGLMGHSLGAGIAYDLALADPTARALVISGAAWDKRAGADRPANMLMIFGLWDEYRRRMTGAAQFPRDWMRSAAVHAAIPEVREPEAGRTYGVFADGTARRVFVPAAIHIQESHSHAAVAEALTWMRQALSPPDVLWLDPGDQIWPVKEWATLAAAMAGIWLLLPLGRLLLRRRFFRPLAGPAVGVAAASGRGFWWAALENGILEMLYLPLIFCLFGIHVYLVRIDRAFPMMMVNGVVWWFFWINAIGIILFFRWHRRHGPAAGLPLTELGVSDHPWNFRPAVGLLLRSAILALVLFVAAAGLEALLEWCFLVDWRFLFPLASDLGPGRFRLMLLYLPFLAVGFAGLGMFLHGRMQRPLRRNQAATFLAWTGTNLALVLIPLLLLLAVQYVPLLTLGLVPLVGPGGMLATFLMNLFHIVLVLVLLIPVSTRLFQLTGRIWTGAFLCALLAAWMFASSQVVAPIPI